MDATHVSAFGHLLGVMARVFRVSLDADHKAAYLMALDDLPYEAVQHACQQALKDETFMPVPAILRAYAREWQRQEALRLKDLEAHGDLLALREELASVDDVRALIESVWPEEAERA